MLDHGQRYNAGLIRSPRHRKPLAAVIDAGNDHDAMHANRQNESRVRAHLALDWLRVLCLNEAGGRIDGDWLRRAREALPGARFLAESAQSEALSIDVWPKAMAQRSSLS